MLEKEIPSRVSEYKIIDVDSTEEFEKVASTLVDLPPGVEYDPDFLYILIRIISSGHIYGPNKNGDYFPEEELLKTYETFNDAHTFKNHENKDIAKAIGPVISAKWNPELRTVEVLKAIDRKLAPEIVRGFEKGYMTDVSMGCRVPYTCCSVCGNKARTAKEYCDHIRRYRMEFLPTGERVFEVNFSPKFHDSSVVLNGAERSAKALVIYRPPAQDAPVAFKKIASEKGLRHYMPITDHEVEKLASYRDNHLHPLLRDETFEKKASNEGLMDKIAEIEKELTGKLVNIVSSPDADTIDDAKEVMQMIKFLTEARFDDESLKTLAATIQTLADSEGLTTQRVLANFIGVAELLGVELFPTELHSLLSYLTDASLSPDLELSSADGTEATPTAFDRARRISVSATNKLPSFSGLDGLLSMYNESPHNMDELSSDPFGFAGHFAGESSLGERPSVKVIRVFQDQLQPFLPMRSALPEHLLPRLMVHVSGASPLTAANGVAQDIKLMSQPETLGDMIANFAYRGYQENRPRIIVSKMTKLASEYMDDTMTMDKIAASISDPDFIENYYSRKQNASSEMPSRVDRNSKSRAMRNVQNATDLTAPQPFKGRGIRKRDIIGIGAPVIYGASAYLDKKRERGDHTSAAENFVADHPGIVTGGTVLGGALLSKKIGAGVNGLLSGGTKALNTAKNYAGVVSHNAGVTARTVADQFKKQSSFESLLSPGQYEGLVKIASPVHSGQYNAFSEENMQRFSKEASVSRRSAEMIKVAGCLRSDGQFETAKEVLASANLPEETVGYFFSKIAEYTKEEFEKAADDFSKSLVLDAVADTRPLSNSIPGRLVDALVFKKIGDMFAPKEPKAVKPIKQKEGEING